MIWSGKGKYSVDCCAVTLHEGEIMGVQQSNFGGLDHAQFKN
jgi:hypothetical protein